MGRDDNKYSFQVVTLPFPSKSIKAVVVRKWKKTKKDTPSYYVVLRHLASQLSELPTPYNVNRSTVFRNVTLKGYINTSNRDLIRSLSNAGLIKGKSVGEVSLIRASYISRLANRLDWPPNVAPVLEAACKDDPRNQWGHAQGAVLKSHGRSDKDRQTCDQGKMVLSVLCVHLYRHHVVCCSIGKSCICARCTPGMHRASGSTRFQRRWRGKTIYRRSCDRI